MAKLFWSSWLRSDGCRHHMDRTFFAGTNFSNIFWRAMRLLFFDEGKNPGLLYKGLLYAPAKEIVARNGRGHRFREEDIHAMLLKGDFKYLQTPLSFQGPDPEDVNAWASAPVDGWVVKLNFYKLVSTAQQGINNFPFQADAQGLDRLVYFTAANILHEIIHNHGFRHPEEVNWDFGSDYASSLPHVAFLSVLQASPHALFFTSDLEIGVPPSLNACKQIGLTGKPFGSANLGASSWGAGRLDVFGRGLNNAIWHMTWEDNRWTDWHDVGGTLTSGPAAVSWGPGRIDIFARGQYDPATKAAALWHMTWEDNRWTEWHPLGGDMTSAPAACSWEPGRLDVFARGGDAALWHMTWENNGWTEWHPLGGLLTSGPTAVSWGPGRIDVFARGQDGACWHMTWENNGWTEWHSLGGELTTAPSVCSWGPGRLDIFARGLDDTLWHMTWEDNHWTEWHSLGGTLTSDPAVVSWGPGRIDIFARGLNGSVWHVTWEDNRWTDWHDLGGTLT